MFPLCTSQVLCFFWLHSHISAPKFLKKRKRTLDLLRTRKNDRDNTSVPLRSEKFLSNFVTMVTLSFVLLHVHINSVSLIRSSQHFMHGTYCFTVSSIPPTEASIQFPNSLQFTFLEITVSWSVMQCRLGDNYWRLAAMFRLHIYTFLPWECRQQVHSKSR